MDTVHPTGKAVYCVHCGCKLVGSYCTKQRGGKAYHRPICRRCNSATKAKGYLLGNALALVDPESMELEISTYENNLRRIVAAASPSCRATGMLSDKPFRKAAAGHFPERIIFSSSKLPGIFPGHFLTQVDHNPSAFFLPYTLR